MDLPKQFDNSRLILSKKNLYISIFYIILAKRTKIELLILEQNVYKKSWFARITIKNYQMMEKTMSQAKLKVIENNTMNEENRTK